MIHLSYSSDRNSPSYHSSAFWLKGRRLAESVIGKSRRWRSLLFYALLPPAGCNERGDPAPPRLPPLPPDFVPFPFFPIASARSNTETISSTCGITFGPE